jgi:signal transduction histidine kinase
MALTELPRTEGDQEIRAMRRLVVAVQELSLARRVDAVMKIVRTVARELTGADGATFILRDQDRCHYVDEDAIGPLWKGQRFPLTSCVSGWAMLNRQAAVIPDIFDDPRVPVDAYRPTFVKSMVMVPVRTNEPIGAIGTYWARPYQAKPYEVELLQTLANTTSVALENVQVYEEPEQRVANRTRQLREANEELEAFSFSVSHDLRDPLSAISANAHLAKRHLPADVDPRASKQLAAIDEAVTRMNQLIEGLLRLAALNRQEIRMDVVNLSQIARAIAARLQAGAPERKADVRIEPDLTVRGDSGLLSAALENLFSNAWKYSSKREQALVEFGRMKNSVRGDAFFVRDNGAGFDMQYAKRLFQPFKRLHSSSEFPGNGIGLATVRRIIERHGGQVWAEAGVDQGATFFFSLPG